MAQNLVMLNTCNCLLLVTCFLLSTSADYLRFQFSINQNQEHYNFNYSVISFFLSSISVLTMRLLQDSSRPLCFWSLHQSWSSRCSSLSSLPSHCPSSS